MKYQSSIGLVSVVLGTVAKSASTSTLTVIQTTTNTVPEIVLVTVSSSSAASASLESQDCTVSGCAPQDLSLPWANSTTRETLSLTNCFTKTVTQFVTSPDVTTTIYQDAMSTPCDPQTSTSILTITVYPVAATESADSSQISSNMTAGYPNPDTARSMSSNHSISEYPSGWSVPTQITSSSAQTASKNSTTTHASDHSTAQPGSSVTSAVITFSGSAGGRIKPPRPILLLAELLFIAGVVNGQHTQDPAHHKDHAARFFPFVAAADIPGPAEPDSTAAKPGFYVEPDVGPDVEPISVSEQSCQMNTSEIVVISTTIVTALPSETVSGRAAPSFMSIVSVGNHTFWWDPLHNRTVTGTVMPTIFTGFPNATAFNALSTSTLDVTKIPALTIIANKTATVTMSGSTPAFSGPVMTMPAEGVATSIVKECFGGWIAICLAFLIGTL